ncbi:methicillin resistance protein [Pusillimonas sp. TS35]|uniref:methicillin resistance protein n=1 Tax=Paracandidimonas lactea TaxID=2895524 RepID=UPI00136C9529|nr:methicillin resistance protein [Paracandidimonas lactea]MYN13581.1 methicillin resistance protein [Pusillimonas sp. TS35]
MTNLVSLGTSVLRKTDRRRVQAPDARTPRATTTPNNPPASTVRTAISGKEAYQALCEIEPSIPLFSRGWWLDAAAGPDNWDVSVVWDEGEIVAAMPYYMKRHLGMRLIVHPPLTQTMGPWFRHLPACGMKRLSEQKKLMNALMEQLPAHDYFEQRWHYSQTNWLPFYWAGYQQTTRYTYILNDISDPDFVCAQFQHGKRQDLRKAEKNLRVEFGIPARTFYDHHVMSLRQRNTRILYSWDVFLRIYEQGHARQASCALGAFDSHNRMHAALFIVWDESSAYGLINTLDQQYKTSGAATLLVREVIRYLSGRTRRFDFEGSMNPAVEASVRQFNSTQTPYFAVWKCPSRLYAFMRFLKSLKQQG